MASVAKLLKVDSNKGLLGNAVRGIGVGTLANVADKKLLGGKLTAMGVSLGQNINGKPVTINATDALTWLAISGFKFKLSSKELLTIVSTVGAKKYFELMDYIDPPTALDINDPRATNVTIANHRAGQQQLVMVQNFRGNY